MDSHFSDTSGSVPLSVRMGLNAGVAALTIDENVTRPQPQQAALVAMPEANAIGVASIKPKAMVTSVSLSDRFKQIKMNQANNNVETAASVTPEVPIIGGLGSKSFLAALMAKPNNVQLLESRLYQKAGLNFTPKLPVKMRVGVPNDDRVVSGRVVKNRAPSYIVQPFLERASNGPLMSPRSDIMRQQKGVVVRRGGGGNSLNCGKGQGVSPLNRFKEGSGTNRQVLLKSRDELDEEIDEYMKRRNNPSATPMSSNSQTTVTTNSPSTSKTVVLASRSDLDAELDAYMHCRKTITSKTNKPVIEDVDMSDASDDV